MMFWNDGHLVFWQVALMWLGMLAFWGLLVWGVYTFFARSSKLPADENRHEAGRRILDQRLAKGDIDESEYRRLLDIIDHDVRNPVGIGDRR